MGGGKFLAIIGGALAIAVIGLFYIMPNIFGWWGVTGTVDYMGTQMSMGAYIGGVSSVGASSAGLSIVLFVMDPILLCAGLLVVVGALLAIIGGAIESKGLGATGGALILLGPLVDVSIKVVLDEHICIFSYLCR